MPSSSKYYLTPTSSLASIAFSWRMRCIWVQMLFLWHLLNKCQVVRNIIRCQRVPWRVMPFSWITVGVRSTLILRLVCSCYPDFLHVHIRRWISMLNNLFQKNIFIITIAILYFNNLLCTICICLRLRRLLYVQIMERVDIYDKYSFKKQKWCKIFTIHCS